MTTKTPEQVTTTAVTVEVTVELLQAITYVLLQIPYGQQVPGTAGVVVGDLINQLRAIPSTTPSVENHNNTKKL